MVFPKILIATLVSVIGLVSCTQVEQPNTETTTAVADTTSKQENMNSYLAMFEIPAIDISRAILFYEALLNIPIEKMEVDGMQMGILPYEGQAVTGVIIQAEGYKPSADGVTVYFNAGDRLQAALDQVPKFGGEIILPKTAHADGSGYFALFLDSEGNKMALNAAN